jgi:hypothetical protein
MLKRLFTSNARIKLLSLFLLNPDSEFFIRELTRKLDEQINSIRRELENLKKLGILKTKNRNRKKYYVVNKQFMLYTELRSIFLKAVSEKESIVKSINEFGDIDVIVLSGMFTEKESPIDLLIVGSIDRSKMEEYFATELETKRPIKFSIMTRDEYLYRRKCNDKFLKEIMEDSSNVVALNKID